MKLLQETIAAAALCLALQCAEAGEWHTYHGDYSLTGLSADKLPDAPVRLWRTQIGKALPSAVVGGNGRIFCIADDSSITALDMRGAIIWQRTLNGGRVTPEGKPVNETFSAPPLYISNNLLVVAADRGDVYALLPADGTTLWTYRIAGRTQGTPNFRPGKDDRQGLVFVTAKDSGTIFALNAADGSLAWKSEPLERTDGHAAVEADNILLGNCTASFIAVSTSDGSTVAKIKVGEESEMAGGVAVLEGKVFAGNRSGSLAAADIAGGTLLWVAEKGTGELFTTPALGLGHVVAHGPDTVLHCAEPSGGQDVWSKDFKGNVAVSPVIAGDIVVAGVDGSLFGMALEDGKELWQVMAGDETTDPAIIDGMLVAGSDDGSITAYGKEEEK
jgi:outer membrane protein assembly factor BamB